MVLLRNRCPADAWLRKLKGAIGTRRSGISRLPNLDHLQSPLFGYGGDRLPKSSSIARSSTRSPCGTEPKSANPDGKVVVVVVDREPLRLRERLHAVPWKGIIYRSRQRGECCCCCFVPFMASKVCSLATYMAAQGWIVPMAACGVFRVAGSDMSVFWGENEWLPFIIGTCFVRRKGPKRPEAWKLFARTDDQLSPCMYVMQ